MKDLLARMEREWYVQAARMRARERTREPEESPVIAYTPPVPSEASQGLLFDGGGSDRYTIHHFELVDDLSWYLQRKVESKQWRDNGGVTATLMAFSGTFVIEAPPNVHRGVTRLIQELRAAEKVLDVIAPEGGEDGWMGELILLEETD